MASQTLARTSQFFEIQMRNNLPRFSEGKENIVRKPANWRSTQWCVKYLYWTRVETMAQSPHSVNLMTFYQVPPT